MQMEKENLCIFYQSEYDSAVFFIHEKKRRT